MWSQRCLYYGGSTVSDTAIGSHYSTKQTGTEWNGSSTLFHGTEPVQICVPHTHLPNVARYTEVV